MVMEGFWLWQLMGRLHPMVVHFPIALLIFGAFLELATIGKFHSKLRPGINLLVLAGAVSVLISALLGFLLAAHEGVEGELLDLHRISGITAAVLSLAVLFLLNQVWKKNQTKSIKAYRRKCN
jgi:uncharacterized membrane protein